MHLVGSNDYVRLEDYIIMIKEGQEITFNNVVYNLVSHITFKNRIGMSVKKQLNCRVCEELDLVADIVNGAIDWDTLRKS